MWRELVSKVYPACAFQAPASEQSLLDVEAALGVALPPELRALLLESNGIQDEYGNGVMSVEQIINFNLYMRSDAEQDDLYMPFASLLCFAEAGNGDVFFFPIQGNGKINNNDVFHWNRETDSRQWIAGDLEDFVEKWYSGTLSV